MKNNNIYLKQVIEFTQDYFAEYEDYKFIQPYQKSDFMLSYKRHISELSTIEANQGFFSVFEEMAFYHIEYMTYLLFKETIKLEEVQLHLQSSTAYSFSMLSTMDMSNKCFSPTPSIWMKNGGFFFSTTILSSTWENVEQIGDILISSINGNNSVIGYGHPEHTKAWFILDLYCKVFSKSYSRERAYLADDYTLFEKILKVWDTADLFTLELLIYELCEVHLNENIETFKKHIELEEDGEAVEHVDVNRFILPYEILVWLKFREKAGLKNPQTFTHPLMNTPIAKMFLDIKEPLPKPKELPYAKELLEKLKEKCPDVEIPEWLDAEKEKKTNPIPTIHLKSNQLAPKTGRYQATLKKEHPQAEFLKSSGFDIKNVQENQSIGTFGLSEEDEDDIVWVYLGV